MFGDRLWERAETGVGLLKLAGKFIFGENAEVVYLSDFDDIKRGSDLAVIFRNPDGSIQQIVTLDVTSAPEFKVLNRKLRRGLQRMITGRLSGAKYILTKSGERIQAEGVPNLLIALSPNVIARWSELLNTNQLEETARERMGILQTMREQLRAQFNQINKNQDKIADLREHISANYPDKAHILSRDSAYAQEELTRAMQFFDEFIKHVGREGANRPERTKRSSTLERLSSILSQEKRMATLMGEALQEVKSGIEGLKEKR